MYGIPHPLIADRIVSATPLGQWVGSIRWVGSGWRAEHIRLCPACYRTHVERVSHHRPDGRLAYRPDVVDHDCL